MAKKINILFFIFALGIFLVPTQHFFAQDLDNCCTETQMDCCSGEHSSKDDPCNSDDSNNKPCNDCTTCNSCHHTILSLDLALENWQITTVKNTTERHYTYLSPNVPSIFSTIWQPPKIS